MWNSSKKINFISRWHIRKVTCQGGARDLKERLASHVGVTNGCRAEHRAHHVLDPKLGCDQVHVKVVMGLQVSIGRMTTGIVVDADVVELGDRLGGLVIVVPKPTGSQVWQAVVFSGIHQRLASFFGTHGEIFLVVNKGHGDRVNVVIVDLRRVVVLVYLQIIGSDGAEVERLSSLGRDESKRRHQRRKNSNREFHGLTRVVVGGMVVALWYPWSLEGNNGKCLFCGKMMRRRERYSARASKENPRQRKPGWAIFKCVQK